MARLRRKHSRGFTLIELMIVISVILILVSVALPAYNQSIWRARESVLKQNLFALRSVISQYTLDKQKAPAVSRRPGDGRLLQATTERSDDRTQRYLDGGTGVRHNHDRGPAGTRNLRRTQRLDRRRQRWHGVQHLVGLVDAFPFLAHVAPDDLRRWHHDLRFLVCFAHGLSPYPVRLRAR